MFAHTEMFLMRNLQQLRKQLSDTGIKNEDYNYRHIFICHSFILISRKLCHAFKSWKQRD